MLGRKSYTQEELDHGRAEVKQQLAAYKKPVNAVADDKARSVLAQFEGPSFNNMTLVRTPLNGVLR